MFRKILMILRIPAALAVLWFVVHSVCIICDGLSDSGTQADLAVVPGNKVNEDGTLSGRLRARLECSLDLYRKHRVKKILVSGGLGKEGFYEGDAMKAFLVAEGVPEALVVVDNAGNTTEATVKNTLKMNQKMHFNNIIVVSQYFHVTRTKKLFREYGFTAVSSDSPLYFEWRDLYSLLREFPAYYTQ